MHAILSHKNVICKHKVVTTQLTMNKTTRFTWHTHEQQLLMVILVQGTPYLVSSVICQFRVNASLINMLH